MNLSEFGIGTTANAVNDLKAKALEVFETPSTIFCPVTNKLVEDGYYTISNQNQKIHGKVSNKGSVLQVSELLDIAYNVSIDNELDLNFGKAQLDYFKDESVATINIPMGVSSFKNAAGTQDDTEVFMFIKTGFGGVACSEIGVYTHRFICSNGMEIRKGLSFFKAKHTERMNELAKVFLSENIPQMMNAKNDFTQLAERLDRTEITTQKIEAFRQKMFDYKKVDDLSTKKANQIKAFNDALEVEMTRGGKTAWALLQGATNYTNHGHYKASKGKDFIIAGAGATFNEKAERYILSSI